LVLVAIYAWMIMHFKLLRATDILRAIYLATIGGIVVIVLQIISEKVTNPVLTQVLATLQLVVILAACINRKK